MTSAGLTREEECILKTALALVVIKSRSNKRLKGTGGDLSTGDEPQNHDDTVVATRNGAFPAAGPSTSTLDRLFDRSPSTDTPAKDKNDDREQSSSVVQPTPQAPEKTAYMQSMGDENHILKIFHAARSLARTVLANRRTTEKCIAGNDVSRDCHGKASANSEVALYGATGHLANQLQILLISDNPTTFTAPGKAWATPVRLSSSQSEKESPKGVNDPDQPTRSPETYVHEMIRSNLLDPLSVTGKTDDGNGLEEDTSDLLAAFHVFQVMVPQLVNLSPALVGHIFQVSTKILRDLYDDKIAVTKRPQEGPMEHKRMLDSLGTSILRLMETCWTSKASFSSDQNNHKRHANFMKEEVQFRLGDLMVPVPLQQIPHVYRDLCNQQKLHTHHLRMMSRAHVRASRTGGTTVSPVPNTSNKAVHEDLPIYTLDAGSKLIIRMAIYRLWMQG
ncbi:MAG: hypothetical protein SGILL_003303 [Bacillariaceae sp.]